MDRLRRLQPRGGNKRHEDYCSASSGNSCCIQLVRRFLTLVRSKVSFLKDGGTQRSSELEDNLDSAENEELV